MIALTSLCNNRFPLIISFSECLSAPVSDIVFIVDQSSITESEQFNFVRNFLYRIVAGLDISSNKVRVGVVLYSNTPKAEMYLDTHENKQDILHHIRRLPFIKRTTAKTGEALRFVRNDVFTTNRGSRYQIGVLQLAVVLTAGYSTDKVSQPAMELRQSGVKVFTLGMKNVNMTELEQIASFPPVTFVFTVEDLANLNTIQRDLRTSICLETNQRHVRYFPGLQGAPGAPGITSLRTKVIKQGGYQHPITTKPVLP